MRFTADGVDIPDELLWAQDEGRVVFFCGAGVSMAKAGLPDFNDLTQRVLDRLGATEEDDARKLHEFAKIAKVEHRIEITTSDQVFQLLRRAFTDADVGTKVAQCLKPDVGVDLAAHRTLLRLARLQTGETRILTTNFDRLFEQCNLRLATVTRSNLPHLAFNEADWGIVHLHGCVKPDYSAPTADGFVLSSAEFGDAYLAMGWARDFVREILDRYVAVFIGYTADDPPIRYLLEGLQQSKRVSNRPYAFQSGPNDQAAASWNAKGVQALIYSTEEGCRHRRLWETLDEWAKRSADPAKWRTRTLKAARRGPAKLAPHRRGMVAHIVNSASGAQAFAHHHPPMAAEWLCVFDPHIRFGEPRSEDGRYDGPVVDPHDRYRLDSDPPPRVKSDEYGVDERLPKNVWSAFSPNTVDLRELGPNQISHISGYFARTNPPLPRRLGILASWIAAVAGQPAAAWWAGQQASLHHEILGRIRLDQKADATDTSQRVVADAWRAIAECHDLQTADWDHAYDLRFRTRRSGERELLAREYASHFSPRLKISNMWRRPVPPMAGSRLRIGDILHVDVEYSEEIRTIEVPDDYLRPLMPKLRAALELAEALERSYSYHIDLCSIEPDDPDDGDNQQGVATHNRQYKLSGHVLHFVNLFRRLVALDPDAARADFASWPRRSVIFERLRVWALGNLDIAPAEEFAKELLALPDNSFWPFRGERDFLLGLANKWPQLDQNARESLEGRILKGPPRDKRTKERDYRARSAHQRLSRINWLMLHGCNFTFDLDAMNARLRLLAPGWKPEFAATAADCRDGKVGWVRTETDYSAIENLPASDVIPYVEGIERRPAGDFVSYEPFQGLSKERPEKALAALSASNGRESFAERFWEIFLRVDIRKDDKPELSAAIVREVVKIADTDFVLIARSASDWFKKIGPDLLTTNKILFDALWDKFIRAIQSDEAANRSSLVRQDRAPDWATESINSAPGNIAELALSIRLDPPRERGEGFPVDWLTRIEQLLALNENSRRYALVIVGHHLNWFFYVDPEWTHAHILSVLEDTASDLDQDALWAGFFWSARTPPHELFMRLKLHLLRMGRQQSEQWARYIEILAGMVLAGWQMKDETTGERLVSSVEMRALLLEASNELRQHIVWYLTRWSADEKGSLASQIAEFLNDAWPKQKSVRTVQISARLCELALSQKSNFPEIAGLVSQLVTKVRDGRLFIPELRNSNETLAGQFPEALLGLLHAILPDNPAQWPYGAEAALKTLGRLHPAIRSDSRYIELESMLR